MSELKPEEWTLYWEESGDVTTCSVGADEGYDGDYIDFWREQIDGQYTPIIDLACGNGALAWVADKLLREQGLSTTVTGFDSADINPFQRLGRPAADYPNIRFVGNTSIESLPLEDASVGMAISQYGLEYANFEHTVPELGRVLKPNARIALVVHTPESVILQEMNENHRLLSQLLSQGDIEQTFLDLDTLFRAHRSAQQVQKDPGFQPLMGRINQAIFPLTNRALAPFTPINNSSQYPAFLQLIINLFNAFANSNTKSKERRRQITTYFDKMRAIIRRAECMQAVAVDERRLGELTGLLEQQGFRMLRCESISQRGHDCGLQLVAER